MFKKQVLFFAFTICAVCLTAENADAQLFRRQIIRHSSPVYHQTYQQSNFYGPIARPFYYSSPQGIAKRIPGQTVPVQTVVANFAPARTQSAARRTYSTWRYYGW